MKKIFNKIRDGLSSIKLLPKREYPIIHNPPEKGAKPIPPSASVEDISDDLQQALEQALKTEPHKEIYNQTLVNLKQAKQHDTIAKNK